VKARTVNLHVGTERHSQVEAKAGWWKCLICSSTRRLATQQIAIVNVFLLYCSPGEDEDFPLLFGDASKASIASIDRGIAYQPLTVLSKLLCVLLCYRVRMDGTMWSCYESGQQRALVKANIWGKSSGSPVVRSISCSQAQEARGCLALSDMTQTLR